jgi:hypothetical protein
MTVDTCVRAALEGQNLEQLVHCPIAAGESDKRPCAHQEMKLAHREIVKAEAQFGTYRRVRMLLVRQSDIETDRLSP